MNTILFGPSKGTQVPHITFKMLKKQAATQ